MGIHNSSSPTRAALLTRPFSGHHLIRAGNTRLLLQRQKWPLRESVWLMGTSKRAFLSVTVFTQVGSPSISFPGLLQQTTTKKHKLISPQPWRLQALNSGVSRTTLPLKLPWEAVSTSLPTSGGSWSSWRGGIAPASACIFPWPSPLCVCPNLPLLISPPVNLV